MKTIRIPTSIRDIKILIKENHDKEYQKRKEAYQHLRDCIKSEVQRAQELSGKEIWQTYNQYFEPVFAEHFYSVMGLEPRRSSHNATSTD